MEKDRSLILEVNIYGCDIEVYLNDIPITLMRFENGERESIPVSQFIVTGINSLTFVINPNNPPSESKTLFSPAKIINDFSFEVTIKSYPRNVFPGDPSGEELFFAKVSSKEIDDEKSLFPIIIKRNFNYNVNSALWIWQKSPKMQLSSELVEEVKSFLIQLKSTLNKGDPSFFIERSMPRVKETLSSYFSNDIDGWIESFVSDVKELESQNLKVILNLESLDLRLVAGGKLIDCISKDWLPALRTEPKEDGESDIYYNLMISKINNSFWIIR